MRAPIGAHATRLPRVAAVVAMVLLTACAQQTVPGAGALDSLSPNAVFRLASPATLQVFGPLGPMMGTAQYAFGSGVLIDKERGFAITNAHVVDGIASVSVRFNDGTQSSAEVAGRSPCDDIAVLHIDHVPSTASTLQAGDSNTAQPGDAVSVLGYPASLASIASEGVVFTQGLIQSVHVRVDQYADLPVYPDTIQHSATINHGNSGGPLVNALGQLIGINTLSNFGTPDEQVQGQFYSISIDHIRPLLTELEAGRSINYAGWDLVPLGELSLDQLFPATGYGTAAQGEQARNTLASKGVSGLVVTNVAAATSADVAGIRPGVLVTTIGTTPVQTLPQACAALSTSSQPVSISGLSLVSNKGVPYTQSWESTVTRQ